MTLVEQGYKYILYDPKGFIRIITRSKSIALHIMREEYGS